ncbi:hypothetical protein Hanom_Chr11g00984781 [Helianthus anomalus]
MAYEARTMDFECPSWNVNAWEAKLKDLGGNPVNILLNLWLKSLPKRLKWRLLLVVMLKRMLGLIMDRVLAMKRWLKEVLLLEGSEVGNDGC